jgi:hypothetical protein
MPHAQLETGGSPSPSGARGKFGRFWPSGIFDCLGLGGRGIGCFGLPPGEEGRRPRWRQCPCFDTPSASASARRLESKLAPHAARARGVEAEVPGPRGRGASASASDGIGGHKSVVGGWSQRELGAAPPAARCARAALADMALWPFLFSLAFLQTVLFAPKCHR